eukprot:365321-Chlamydomonas_euryale.AAC.11
MVSGWVVRGRGDPPPRYPFHPRASTQPAAVPRLYGPPPPRASALHHGGHTSATARRRALRRRLRRPLSAAPCGGAALPSCGRPATAAGPAPRRAARRTRS